jgi:hypothetical protein
MALPKFLDVDGKKRFPKIVNALNEVFCKKNARGEELGGAFRSVWKIKEGKKAWFPYLATPDKNNGWKQPNVSIDWVNIPSPDMRTITQIPLKPPKGKYPNENDKYAVFVRTDTKEGSRFFGIFQYQKEKNKNKKGICIWNRISAALDLEEWEAEPK